SGLLKRNISAATGVSANTAPASRPAPGPNQRLIVLYRIPTAATPSSACGSSMLQLLKPNRRPERSITHSDAGGLFDGDEVGCVERAEEERLPAVGAGLHGGRVEGVGP